MTTASGGPGRLAVRHGPSGLAHEVAGPGVPHDLRQMLMQGPAVRHVQHLHAATDGEQRHIPGQGCPAQ